MSSFETVIETVKKSIPDADVQLFDLGGGNHLRIEIVSREFSGKSLIQQHKMVHDILDHQMENRGGFIHALSIKTSVPKE
jgi:stress-induced morphogen